MCTVLGVLGTLVVTKLAVRAFRRQHGGSGPHRFHRGHHGRFRAPWMRRPIDLGELDESELGTPGREARDALEHLHNILTEELRASLPRVLPATA